MLGASVPAPPGDCLLPLMGALWGSQLCILFGCIAVRYATGQSHYKPVDSSVSPVRWAEVSETERNKGTAKISSAFRQTYGAEWWVLLKQIHANENRRVTHYSITTNNNAISEEKYWAGSFFMFMYSTDFLYLHSCFCPALCELLTLSIMLHMDGRSWTEAEVAVF